MKIPGELSKRPLLLPSLNTELIDSNSTVALIWFESKTEYLHPAHMKVRLFMSGVEILESPENNQKFNDAIQIIKRKNLETGMLKTAFEYALKKELEDFESSATKNETADETVEDLMKRVHYEVLDDYEPFRIKQPSSQECVI